MSNQPKLLTVAKTRPSRTALIRAFKKEHRIFTHRSSSFIRVDRPWTALLMPDDVTEATAVEHIGKWCVRLADCHLLVTGEGELSAIRTLCWHNKITCDL